MLQEVNRILDDYVMGEGRIPAALAILRELWALLGDCRCGCRDYFEMILAVPAAAE